MQSENLKLFTAFTMLALVACALAGAAMIEDSEATVSHGTSASPLSSFSHSWSDFSSTDYQNSIYIAKGSTVSISGSTFLSADIHSVTFDTGTISSITFPTSNGLSISGTSVSGSIAANAAITVEYEGDEDYVEDQFHFIVVDSGSSSTVAVTKISISGSSSVTVGSTISLSASVTPSNATDKSVTWKSSSTSIATVSSSGVVTGVKAGTVTITCTAADGSGVYGTKSITVNAASSSTVSVTGVTISGATEVWKGNTIQLTASVTPSTATDKTVTWSVSSGSSYATVDSSGVVTGVKAGTAVIKATANDGSGKSATRTITVNAGSTYGSSSSPLSSVSGTLDKYLGSTIYLAVNGTVNLTYTSSDTKNVYATGLTSGFGISIVNKGSTSWTNVAGVFTKAGTCTATCSYETEDTNGDQTVQITIIGVTVPVSSITISGSSSVNVDSTTTLSASVSPSSASNKTVTWKSSDTSIATVSSSGVVTGVKAGTVTITCTASDGSGVSATKSVTVNSTSTPVTSITISGSSSVTAGSTITLTASVSPSTATNKSVTWKSSDTSIATVSSSGVVTGVKAGTVTITCTAADGSGVSATKSITVNAASKTFNLYFNANGGSGAPSSKSGTTTSTSVAITIPSTKPSRSGYDFLGWSTSSTATSASYSAGGSITISKDTTLYAVWKQATLSFTTTQADKTITTGTSFAYTVGTNVSGCTVSVSGPSWLSVSGSTVYGTPSSTGEYDVTVTISKSGYTSATQSFTLTVISSLEFTSVPTNGLIVVEK